MKNLFFIFALGVFTATNAFAQVSVKGGINIASISEEGEDVSRDDINNRSVIAPVLGLAFDLNLSNVFTIQPEFLYAQSGGKNSYTVLGVENTSTYKINYFEVPVLAKVKIGNASNNGLGVYVAAGPWIGYALNGKYKYRSVQNENSVLEINRNYTFDDEDDTKRINYGMIGAVGLSMGKTTLDLRYNYGINNLLDDDANNNNDNDPVLQTRGVALTLGFSF